MLALTEGRKQRGSDSPVAALNVVHVTRLGAITSHVALLAAVAATAVAAATLRAVAGEVAGLNVSATTVHHPP